MEQPRQATAEQLGKAVPLLPEDRFCGPSQGLRLRETCRAARAGHDAAAQRLCLGSVRKLFSPPVLPGLPPEMCLSNWQPPSPEQIEASVRGLLARGFRPATVSVELPWRHGGEPASEQRVLSLLSTVAAAGSVTQVRVGEYTPLTEEVVRAIAAVSPKLAALRVMHGDSVRDRIPDLWQPPPPTPEQSEAATAAARLLLALTGPAGLRELRLSTHDRHWPPAALDSLVFCTALTTLELRWGLRAAYLSGARGRRDEGLDAETSLLRTLSSLTSLRDLSLSGGAETPRDVSVRQARAACLESCLSPLTALTRLDISLHSLQHFPRRDLRETAERGLGNRLQELRRMGKRMEAAALLAAAATEWRALVAAARRMPGLRELSTPAQADAADLASLRALTQLRVGAITRPSHQTAAAPAMMYDLPPLLQRLVVHAPLSMHTAKALRPSPAAAPAAAAAAAASAAAGAPGRIAIHAGGLHWGREGVQLTLAFSEHADVDAEGRMTAEAAAAMRRALGGLRGPFDLAPDPRKPDRGLRVYVADAPAQALPPAAAGGASATAGDASAAGTAAAAVATHCGSWLGGVGDLRLARLELSGLVLSPPDLVGLARCLEGLKALDLVGCTHSVSSLPLLAGLESLEELRLNSRDWESPDWQVPSAGEITAAFLGLVVAPGAGAAGDDPGPAQAQAQSRGPAGDGGGSVLGGEVPRSQRPLPLPLPQLRAVHVDCDELACEWGWLEEAMAPARAELARRRPLRANIHVRFMAEMEEF